jgi:hypothetical protein
MTAAPQVRPDESERLVEEVASWIDGCPHDPIQDVLVKCHAALLALQADARRKNEALRELVRLKDLKELIERNPSQDWLDKRLPWSAREREYAESQPKAWEAARASIVQARVKGNDNE